MGCLSCLVLETQETNRSPVWCHGDHVGTPRSLGCPLAGLPESTGLHLARKGSRKWFVVFKLYLIYVIK